MDLKSTLQSDLKTAMKAKDSLKLNSLRMLIADIKKREIDKRSPLSEEEVQKAISSMLKQRNDSVDAFEKGGRQDLADKEREEAAILQAYLPQPLSRAEIEAIVTQAVVDSGAAGPSDLGKVMKLALAKAAGRADGKLLNEVVRAKLQPAKS